MVTNRRMVSAFCVLSVQHVQHPSEANPVLVSPGNYSEFVFSRHLCDFTIILHCAKGSLKCHMRFFAHTIYLFFFLVSLNTVLSLLRQTLISARSSIPPWKQKAMGKTVSHSQAHHKSLLSHNKQSIMFQLPLIADDFPTLQMPDLMPPSAPTPLFVPSSAPSFTNKRLPGWSFIKLPHFLHRPNSSCWCQEDSVQRNLGEGCGSRSCGGGASHTMHWVGRDFEDHVVPIPLHKFSCPGVNQHAKAAGLAMIQPGGFLVNCSEHPALYNKGSSSLHCSFTLTDCLF